MMERGRPTENERRDWIVILVILLIGFLCVMLAGGWAIRFAPVWKLDTDMGSNLDPDSDFLTNRPVGYFEPLDPSILTLPVWLNGFLTPGASFPTRTPVPPTDTPLATNTLPIPSNTPTRVPSSPTPTLPFFPSPTSTPRPNTPLPPTSTSASNTNTPVTPPTAIPVDLSVTKTDGAGSYIAGSTVTYSVVVTNNGPNNVTGATVGDAKPAQVTTWGWCAAPCTPVANTSGGLGATVNLNSGASVTYVILANIDPAATGNLVNTATVGVPSGYTDTVPGNNSATDTNTPAFSADLSVTKTDNATHYVADATKTYVIVVANNGPSNVTGATVADAFTNPNILPGSVTWTCSGTGGGTCAAGGSGDINDSVNLPAGATVTYIADITVVSSPSGPLENTATVTEPPGVTDPVPGNNSATDSDTLITTVPPPPEFGGPPDNGTYTLPAGGSLTLSINLSADGNTADWDIIYYEYSVVAIPPDFYDGIWLDWIIIEISDGSNWYTIFNWGDNISDTNTNVAHVLLTDPPPPPNPEEMDQRPIATGDLYNGTGVAIDIDSLVPPGTYTYIRISAPSGDSDGQAEIDTIEILP